METQFFFNILILSVIVTYGICALSEENEQSSDILIRKKRIIDHRKSYAVSSIGTVPYIVNIEKFGDNSSLCGGTILEPHIIITTAQCVPDHNTQYRILSASHLRNRGNVHIIRRKFIHQFYNPNTLKYNIALLVIEPIISGFPNRKIEMYEGRGPHSNAFCTLSGWGCIHLGARPIFPARLRSVQVQIMKRDLCENYYRLHNNISDTEICTMDRNGQTGSCDHDTGGPLVLNGLLIGILSWTKVIQNRRFPDVYVYLNHPIVRNWINSVMESNRHQVIDLNRPAVEQPESYSQNWIMEAHQ